MLRFIFILLFCLPARAEFLNLTNFGAWGDAQRFTVSATSNSIVLTTSNQCSIKPGVQTCIELFGAGQWGKNSTSNRQDMVAFVTNVVNGTNIYMDRVANYTTNCFVWMGTYCSTSFQAMVDVASSINTTCTIPAGVYMMLPSCQFTNFVMANKNAYPAPAVSISKGGITFQGAGMTNTTLLGCGAWMLKTNFVGRGGLFWMLGPVTNNSPLVFADMTMDGGITTAFNPLDNYWPANTTTGTGWDESHDVMTDMGEPLHNYKEFRNCKFTHWLGETLITVSSWNGGLTMITNCQFIDGNASAVNLGAHAISGCLISNYNFSIEFYAGWPTNASSFKNSTLANCISGMVMTGAETNLVMPTYTISGNTFNSCTNWSLLMGPTRNLNFYSNNIVNGGGIITGGAYQSTTGDHNQDIVVYANNFTNVYIPIGLEGSGGNRTVNFTATNNVMDGCGSVAMTSVGSVTNAVFRNNRFVNPGDRFRLYYTSPLGQYFLDDLSNEFPPFDTTIGSTSTNNISYGKGMRQTIAPLATNCAFNLVASGQVQAGSILLVTNTGTFNTAVDSVALAIGAGVRFNWNGTGWQTNALTTSGYIQNAIIQNLIIIKP